MALAARCRHPRTACVVCGHARAQLVGRCRHLPTKAATSCGAARPRASTPTAREEGSRAAAGVQQKLLQSGWHSRQSFGCLRRVGLDSRLAQPTVGGVAVRAMPLTDGSGLRATRCAAIRGPGGPGSLAADAWRRAATERVTGPAPLEAGPRLDHVALDRPLNRRPPPRAAAPGACAAAVQGLRAASPSA